MEVSVCVMRNVGGCRAAIEKDPVGVHREHGSPPIRRPGRSSRQIDSRINLGQARSGCSQGEAC